MTENRTKWRAMIGGIIFTLIFAVLGYGLVTLPGFDHIGQLACSILLAVLYRQIWGYPEAIRSGIQFSAKKLLRLAIIFYGLKLNIAMILQQGLGLLAHDVMTIVFAMVCTMLLAKLFKADKDLSLLLGIGTGICGAAAIAAVSPILRAKEEDTAIGVGVIALIGTIFSIAYTLLRPVLSLTAVQYGIWSGISLHEIAHVALAATPAGSDALAMALLAKLGRVFLLVPLCFGLLYWMRRKGGEKSAAQVEFPWFLLGFVAMSLVGSYGPAQYFAPTSALQPILSGVTVFLLTMAMVGLGLNVSLKEVREKAMRPLAAMVITSLLLSALTLVTI